MKVTEKRQLARPRTIELDLVGFVPAPRHNSLLPLRRPRPTLRASTGKPVLAAGEGKPALALYEPPLPTAEPAYGSKMAPQPTWHMRQPPREPESHPPPTPADAPAAPAPAPAATIVSPQANFDPPPARDRLLLQRDAANDAMHPRVRKLIRERRRHMPRWQSAELPRLAVAPQPVLWSQPRNS